MPAFFRDYYAVGLLFLAKITCIILGFGFTKEVMMKGIRILGTGSAVGSKVVDNDELAPSIDSSHEWIYTRSGICSRHLLAEGETGVGITIDAARQAMAAARVEPSELGLIIVATSSSESICPPMACQVAHALGTKCPAFDINAACSGFIYMMEVVHNMLPGLQAPALVIGSDMLSRVTDWSDRTSCFLFGDGAGALVVDGEGEVLASQIMAYPDNDNVLNITGLNWQDEEGKPVRSCIKMNGREVFKFATRQLVEDVRAVLEKAKKNIEDIRWFVCHQANGRILRAAAEKLGVDQSRFFVNIDKMANTSAATIPIALHEMFGKGLLHKGDLVMLAAFGGGLTSGAMLLRW